MIIYVEKGIKNHHRTKKLLSRFSDARVVSIQKYTEVFNRKDQNFRLQKQKPALILAEKKGVFVHKTPDLYSIGRKNNFYFSHILNCPFDCDYCFLQGMYRSAFYVLFVNYEDFAEEVLKIPCEKNTMSVFTGYDGDSLALNAWTHFWDFLYPLAEKTPSIEYELRTKSVAIRSFLHQRPLENMIIAYSLNPEIITKKIEKKTPPLSSRLRAIQELQRKGFSIGLRFDPIIDCQEFSRIYEQFFTQVFETIDCAKVHSVTLGPFRVPKSMQKNLEKLRPLDPLLASNQSSESLDFCEKILYNHFPKDRIFLCYEPSCSQGPLPVLDLP